jgi:hypothetical protein
VTLAELSCVYCESAETLRLRIRTLRSAAQQTGDPAVSAVLRRRAADLTPLLRETRELAALTAHYYDRGYYRNEKYVF